MLMYYVLNAYVYYPSFYPS